MRAASLATTRKPCAGIRVPGGNLKWMPSVSCQAETSRGRAPRLKSSIYSGIWADFGGSYMISLITMLVLRCGWLGSLRDGFFEANHSLEPSGQACQLSTADGSGKV